ncbi:Dual specificity protein phosphatase 2 [Oopsacas minuta]|uniref:Dual specificity protein phosphatase 2 n=1 Tax=Oopsacas minuta TaxID=111878 RepID=A0AAV7KJ59_9METZ|nr:Dual specificity protein phosphatase 2 [Oopsacas minuta]
METPILRNKPTFRTLPHINSYPSMSITTTTESDNKPKINKFTSLNFLPVGDDFEFEQIDEEYMDSTRGPSEILEHLYIGSEEHASCISHLEENNITNVLNVAKGCKNYFKGDFKYHNLPVLDVCEEDISVIFEEAIEIIEKVRLDSGKILVHCNAGISRSATVCAAYLMKSQGISMDDALKIIKDKRRCIAPNFGFMLKLMKFQDTLTQD